MNGFTYNSNVHSEVHGYSLIVLHGARQQTAPGVGLENIRSCQRGDPATTGMQGRLLQAWGAYLGPAASRGLRLP